MGQAKSASFRMQLIKERREQGYSYRALAAKYSISYNTARHICVSYERYGQAALQPDYSACGRPISAQAERNYRLVRLLKYLHPQWGIPFIVSRLKVAYPDLVLQSIRHYQRRIKADQINRGQALPTAKLPKPSNLRDVRQPHQEWQIDAKEQIELLDGSPACYLNVTDTKTNALLATKVFPPQPD